MLTQPENNKSKVEIKLKEEKFRLKKILEEQISRCSTEEDTNMRVERENKPKSLNAERT